MIEFRPTQLQPVTRPQIADAHVLGDLLIERVVWVRIGAFVFRFWREEDGAWTGGEAAPAGRGGPVDEGWLTAARSVAVEAMKADLAARGEAVATPTETFRCALCNRIMTSKLAVGLRPAVEICGPVHIFSTGDGRALTVRPDGSSAWSVDEAAK